eukprot:1167083-Ditylum_brightwellii.AAC.1
MSAQVGTKNTTRKKDGAKSGRRCCIFLSIMGTLCLALQLHLSTLQKSFDVQNEGWAHRYHPMHEINSAQQQKRPPANRNNLLLSSSVIDIHAIADKWKLSRKKKKNGSSNDIISLLEKASQ